MLTDDQVHEAIDQMIVHCDLKMENYVPLSARATLYALGYADDEISQVLRFVADGGFHYCLDREIRMTGNHEDGDEFPMQSVCYWGPDQLKSRLQSLRNHSSKQRRSTMSDTTLDPRD